jgi:hypothetical protein
MALLIGLGVPAFLVGPALFEGVSWSAFSGAQLGWSMAALCFGVWLFLVSCLAESEDVWKVMEPFQGSEAVVLFLPYMLWIGTRSIAGRVRRMVK